MEASRPHSPLLEGEPPHPGELSEAQAPAIAVRVTRAKSVDESQLLQLSHRLGKTPSVPQTFGRHPISHATPTDDFPTTQLGQSGVDNLQWDDTTQEAPTPPTRPGSSCEPVDLNYRPSAVLPQLPELAVGTSDPTPVETNLVFIPRTESWAAKLAIQIGRDSHEDNPTVTRPDPLDQNPQLAPVHTGHTTPAEQLGAGDPVDPSAAGIDPAVPIIADNPPLTTPPPQFAHPSYSNE